MSLNNFDKNIDTNDSNYNDILNSLTAKFNDFISNESNIYNFNDSLKNKLQTILTNIQKLKDKIQLLFLNIDDLKQKILDNETKINNNNKESQDVIAKLSEVFICPTKTTSGILSK
jgi:chromosome segregation ATPase